GARDPVTPPERAVQTMATFSRAQHIVAPQLGHGVSYGSCGPKMMRQFYDEPDKNVDGKCLTTQPAASFVMSAAGPQP
ncbi:MAG: hypothetical protein RL748_2906, partial [Pseudomonadota bacterium]